jgi:hypothetical protein
MKSKLILILALALCVGCRHIVKVEPPFPPKFKSEEIVEVKLTGEKVMILSWYFYTKSQKYGYIVRRENLTEDTFREFELESNDLGLDLKN